MKRKGKKCTWSVTIDLDNNIQPSVKREPDGSSVKQWDGPRVRGENFPDRGCLPHWVTEPPKDAGSNNLDVEAAMKTDTSDFTFGCASRPGLLAPVDPGAKTEALYWKDGGKSFEAPVWSFHAHHYFNCNDPASVKEALELRALAIQTFPDITVNQPFRGPVGPHPTANWECEMYTPESLSAYLPWLVQHHGNLCVLIHPNTGQGFEDHTTDGYWIGDPAKDLPKIQAGVHARFKKLMRAMPDLQDTSQAMKAKL